jgi:hypothetical protein
MICPGHRGPAGQNRHPHPGRLQGGHRRPGRVVQARCGHPDDHGDQAVGAAGGFGERFGRGVGAEVDDVEALPAQQVGDDRAGQAVLVPGRPADDDRAALAAAPGEPRPQPPDDPLGHGRRAVLGGHGDRPLGPAVADAAQHRHEEVQVDAGRLLARSQRILDDPPRPGLVAGHHPGPQQRHAVPPRRTHGASRPERFRRMHQVEITRVDQPFLPGLAGGQPPGPHVAVGGHVVHAESLGCFAQADRLGRARGWHRGHRVTAGPATRPARAAGTRTPPRPGRRLLRRPGHRGRRWRPFPARAGPGWRHR